MTRAVFDYALLRAVPRIERGETVNVGVVVYCQQNDFLEAAAHVDVARLTCLDAEADVEAVREALDAICAVCRGDAAAGPAGALPRGERFRWLTAPRSTIVQPGPVHAGLTADPAAELERLLQTLVR
jgi:hypothetical protein